MLSAAALAAPGAHARPTLDCGKRAASYAIRTGGVRIATLVITADRRTGARCASLFHRGPAVGRARLTRVYIGACTRTRPGVCRLHPASFHEQQIVTDDHAGPVRTSVRGACMLAGGWVRWHGRIRAVDTPPRGSACG